MGRADPNNFTVVNGWLGEWSVSGNLVSFEIYPLEDGNVTIVIEEDVILDRSLNGNYESNVLRIFSGNLPYASISLLY